MPDARAISAQMQASHSSVPSAAWAGNSWRTASVLAAGAGIPATFGVLSNAGYTSIAVGTPSSFSSRGRTHSFPCFRSRFVWTIATVALFPSLSNDADKGFLPKTSS